MADPFFVYFIIVFVIFMFVGFVQRRRREAMRQRAEQANNANWNAQYPAGQVVVGQAGPYAYASSTQAPTFVYATDNTTNHVVGGPILTSYGPRPGQAMEPGANYSGTSTAYPSSFGYINPAVPAEAVQVTPAYSNGSSFAYDAQGNLVLVGSASAVSATAVAPASSETGYSSHV